MSAIDEYQKMVDAKTKPGYHIDLKNDKLQLVVSRYKGEKGVVQLIPQEDSPWDQYAENEVPLTLTHQRLALEPKKEVHYPFNDNFGNLTKEKKLEYVIEQTGVVNLSTASSAWNSSGFFQWYAADDDLLYYGGSVILSKWQFKAHYPGVPMRSVKVDNKPVLWVGPVETVIPVAWIQEQLPDLEISENDLTISFTWDSYGLLRGVFDWSGRYGTPGGVFICQADPSEEFSKGYQGITVRHTPTGQSRTFQVLIRYLDAHSYWGNPTEDGLLHHYEPGTATQPIIINEYDVMKGGCWVYLSHLVSGLGIGKLETWMKENTPLKLPQDEGGATDLTIAESTRLNNEIAVRLEFGEVFANMGFSETDVDGEPFKLVTIPSVSINGHAGVDWVFKVVPGEYNEGDVIPKP